MTDIVIIGWVTVMITVGIGVLYIHKIGISKFLRMIGNCFIAAGDAVDHWKDRNRQLNLEAEIWRRTGI